MTTVRNYIYNIVRSFTGLSAILLIVLFGVFGIVNSQAQERCIFERITNDPDVNSTLSVISTDGNWITFQSSADLLGQNPDTNLQVYLYDVEGKKLSQVTPGNIDGQSRQPAINTNGSKISFHSSANLTGNNTDGNDELFLYHANTGTFQQVTDTTGSNDTINSSISGNGTIIAFESKANINGGNPDGSSEIYFFSTLTSIITQITDSLENSRDAAINENGTVIGLESSDNINGTNPENNQEIYTYNIATATFQTITMEDSGNSFDPSFNAPGTIVSFESTSNINGGNPGNDREIYYHESGVITQVTFTGLQNQDPAISADGNIIAFQSPADFTGENPLGSQQIFTFHIPTGTFTQITNITTGSASKPSPDASGKRIALFSNGDILSNTTNNRFQIYLYECLPVAVPTLSQWSMLAFAVILGMAGVLSVRRKSIAQR